MGQRTHGSGVVDDEWTNGRGERTGSLGIRIIDTIRHLTSYIFVSLFLSCFISSFSYVLRFSA
jgi:hypothetical protein